MNQITVIIPTLLKSNESLLKLISKLSNLDIVQRILIFDNTLGEFCKQFKEKEDMPNKVVIYDQENLYVNLAWNRGVSLCDTEYYALLNDDISFSPSLIEECVKILDEKEEIGLVTCNTEKVTDIKEHLDPEANTNTIEYTIHDKDNLREKLNGWISFGRVKEWRPINERLKIFFGDNVFFINCINSGKKIAYITNRTIYHQESKTVKELKLYEEGILAQEEQIFKELLQPVNMKRRVLVGTPTIDGKLCVQYVDSLVQTILACEKLGIEVHPLYIAYDSLLCRARNDLIHTAVMSGVSDLFYIDSDEGWKVDDFLRMLNHPVDVVSGTARRKGDEESYVCKAFKSGLILDKEKGLIEILGCGTGFLRLSRKAFVALYEASPPYIDKGETKRFVFNIGIDPEDGTMISEDIIATKKLRDLGFQIFIDPYTTCDHIGIKNFQGDFFKWATDNKLIS